MRIVARLAEKISAMAPEEIVHIIVKLRSFEKGVLSELAQQPFIGIRQVIKMANAISIALPVERIESLLHEPWIERIEEDEKVYAVLDESVGLVGAHYVQERGLSGKGIKIAIIDTGIDRAHPDFADRIVAVRDFTLEGFKDGNGHGSHVAGIAAGSGSYSGRKYKGIAPGALIMAGKVLKADGSGRMSDVMVAIEWAVELGADIINLSLTSANPSDGNDALCEMCDLAVDAGVVVCVAAGNDGPDRRVIGSPAAARRVITVGAVTPTGFVAEFSSRGPTVDDRLKPEIIAPGVDIISVRARDTRAGKPLDKYYTSATGTSMAASHVSGVAALLLEANRKASPQLIKEALMNTAKDLGVDDYSQGSGMLTADLALEYVQTRENPLELVDHAPPSSALLNLIINTYEALVQNKWFKRKWFRRKMRAQEQAR